MSAIISDQSEYYIIGALMISPELLASVDILEWEFYYPEPRQIFSAMKLIFKSGITPDIISISEMLRGQTNSNWLPLLAQIQKNQPSSKLLDQHIELVRNANIKRKAVEIFSELQNRINSDFELTAIDRAIASLMNLARVKQNYESNQNAALQNAYQSIERSFSSGELAGIPTGLKCLDKVIGGWQKTDLYVIGARPAMGKTAFMLNNILAAGVPAGFISTEQGREQIGMRSIAITGSVSVQKMRIASRLEESDWSKISAAIPKIKDKPIMIYDNPAVTIEECQRIARKWKHINKIEILFIDYIQRIKGDGRLKRFDQVGEIVMGLKEIARELNIPVVALSQVSRAVDGRNDKRPGMADLSDSSAIEKEADVVMTLYRDEVYNLDSQDAGVLEIWVEKNRHGPTGLNKAAWIGEYMQVRDLVYGYQAF